MTANNVHISSKYVSDVLSGRSLGGLDAVSFRNPDSFSAGGLHAHFEKWKQLADSIPGYPQASEVLRWIQHGVDINDFLVHYKGSYKGNQYDCALPPAKIFSNHLSCKPFTRFISQTVLSRLGSGAISLWGRVGEVKPPHLVMPLTVEPSKPRLCNDNRFLNLWIVDRPFKLDSLKDLRFYVFPDFFQTVCDDKSGYDHLHITEESRTYFGFQWAGWYFVSACIPFGWKTSAFIYHSTGSLVSHYFRSKGIPCSLYIDDRHVSQLCLPDHPTPAAYQYLSTEQASLEKAKAAIFFVCFTLVSLGYTIGLAKSILAPSKIVPYLGFEVNSHLQAFVLLSKKRDKFIAQLKSILASDQVEMVTLQKLAGKCISMALAVPGARLFTNEINLAISRCGKSSRPAKIKESLRSELEHWLFLDSWDGFLPWRAERHHHIRLYTDASSYAWGGFFSAGAVAVQISDYWDAQTRTNDITVKETLALAKVLSSFKDTTSNSWVDVFTDSQVLIKAWQRHSARSHAFSESLKEVFRVMMSLNIELHLYYISSADNPADGPSRRMSLQDAKLGPQLWQLVQREFGGTDGHSVDLMALPSNAQASRKGEQLPFFAPHPCPSCLGVNIFAQVPGTFTVPIFRNPYVFPPICLVDQVLRFLISLGVGFTVVLPDVRPRRHWWPVVWSKSGKRQLLAHSGCINALLIPSKEGYRGDYALPWDLWAFQFAQSSKEL